MIVFRSLVIPLQAAVMNLLSISAALGVIVAIFQWGWLGGLFGVQQGPIESFIPVMLFAIVFGLSMDYEVFLISRMHERWTQTREHSRAVAEGLALTGRVVTAAAAIMVCVFLSFMLGEDRVIKEFGLSLASAVFLDALVVRCLLLPAVLHLVGERTWQIPAWLDRLLPRLNIEGTVLPADAPARAARAADAPRRAPRAGGPASRPRGPRAEPTVRRGAAPLLALLCVCAVAIARPRRGPERRGGRPIHAAIPSLLAFVPAGEPELARVPGLSVGIMSATQGPYSAAQLLLDITQGARIAASAYPRPARRRCRCRTLGAARCDRGLAGGAQARRKRAPAAAPRPARRRRSRAARHTRGSLGPTTPTRSLAADRGGARGRRLARHRALRCSRASPLLRRAHRLVVADLPAGRSRLRGPAHTERHARRGRAAARRAARTVRARPRTAVGRRRGAPTGRTAAELTSQTTNERGLDRRGRYRPHDPAPSGPHPDPGGHARRSDPHRRPACTPRSLRSLMARLHVIGPRRLHAFGWLLSAWALLLLASAPWPHTRAWAMRTGSLGVLWAPVAVLIPAALSPSAAVEYLTIAFACLALGALTDRLLPWPRAPLAPAIVAILALTIDALSGTQLLMRSLLGPDPILGARFYGIGNELKSGLAVLVLAAVAAALYPAMRGRRAAYRDGRRRHRARRRRGLGADRRRGRRSDPGQRRHCRGDRHAAARCAEHAGAP